MISSLAYELGINLVVHEIGTTSIRCNFSGFSSVFSVCVSLREVAAEREGPRDLWEGLGSTPRRQAIQERRLGQERQNRNKFRILEVKH